MPPPFGSRLSFGKDLVSAARNALAMGADTFEVLPGSMILWDRPHDIDEEIAALKQIIDDAGVQPLLRGAWLANLTLPGDKLARKSDLTITAKSIDALKADLAIAEQLGIRWVIVAVDPNSREKLNEFAHRVAERINRIFADTASLSAGLAIEPPALKHYETSFDYVQSIISRIEDQARVSVYFIPEQHYETNREIATPDGLASMLKAFDDRIGLGRVSGVLVTRPRVPKYIDTIRGISLDVYTESMRMKLLNDVREFYRPLCHDPRFQNIPFILNAFPDAEYFMNMKRLLV